ncbi:MAG TPA: FimV/HubP family polar landmark protein [Rhodanobacter sp.]|nr:FimV/HubP family polar landmark protein [Rhodanobacter sp.]
MNRSLKLSMLVALALGSSQVMALDLGKVQVKSALGQPLLAEIPLHPTHPGELQGLTVQLASSDEFARAGIVGGRTTIPLHFSVADTGDGHRVIRITSSASVDDPLLDLLIEVKGKSGKSVREYAILLDPPGSQPVTPVAAASHAAASPRATARPKPVAAAPTAPGPAVGNGQYGPVKAGQTLSGIARSTAPAGIDVQQMMLALQQANPDAFYRHNINALKRGAVLRVPSATDAQAVKLAAAIAEVRRQNSDWRANAPGKPAVVADTASRTSNSGSTSSESADNGDRLALVPPKTGDDGTRGGGKGDKSAASARADLLRARESMASLQQQSADLKTRLKDLTDINNKNEHLLSLKDGEIAELQAKLAAARKASAKSVPAAAATVAEVASKPVATETPAAAKSAPGTSTSAGSMMASASTALAPAAAATNSMSMTPPAAASTAPASAGSAMVPASAKPAAVKPVSKPTPPPHPTEQPWYMQTWAWGAAAVAVLLLIVLIMMGRRRKPAATASKSASSLADRFGAPSSDDDNLLDDADTDQEQLLDQLAEHPDDIYLHLELVTLYYSRRDVEHFEAAAEAMYAHVTDPAQDEWQDVVHMGEDLVPEHPLFDHHDESHAEAATGGNFDINDYDDASDAPTVVSSMPPAMPKKVSEYNFNFDLTQPHASEPAFDQPVAADDVTVVAPHVADVAPIAHDDVMPPVHAADERGNDAVEFSDDPIDTKLDLARAYLDMGDADGARAMLGEVLKEGSQIQRDTAQRLLDGLV